MTADAVNHHAGHPGFAGVTGLVAGLAMIVGRGTVVRLAADLASVSDADRVIDVGCGPGTAVREAARRGARVTGVDPAPVMRWLARTLTRDRPAITWAEGAAENLRQPDGPATVLWSLATVHHWADVTEGLAEARRVLAPGGRLLAIERRVRPGPPGMPAMGGRTSRPSPSRLSAGQPASTTCVSRSTRQADVPSLWSGPSDHEPRLSKVFIEVVRRWPRPVARLHAHRRRRGERVHQVPWPMPGGGNPSGRSHHHR
jgi:SAM-dependent methyltransferase